MRYHNNFVNRKRNLCKLAVDVAGFHREFGKVFWNGKPTQTVGDRIEPFWRQT